MFFLLKLNYKNSLFFEKKSFFLETVNKRDDFGLKGRTSFFNPKSFVSYKPYVYRSRKYGRKFYLNFFKNITFSKVVFFQMKKHNFAKSNIFKSEEKFISMATSTVNSSNSVLFEKNNYLKWYSTIINKYKYHSYTRNTKIYPKIKDPEFLSLWSSLEYRRFYHRIDKRVIPSYLNMFANFKNFNDSFFSKIKK